MKNRGKINSALEKSLTANMSKHDNYYTPTQVKSEGLPECTIEWVSITKTLKNLVNTFKRGRGNYERTTYIQVCE